MATGHAGPNPGGPTHQWVGKCNVLCLFTDRLCVPIIHDVLPVHGLTTKLVNAQSDGQEKGKNVKKVTPGPKNFDKKGSRH